MHAYLIEFLFFLFWHCLYNKLSPVRNGGISRLNMQQGQREILAGSVLALSEQLFTADLAGSVCQLVS
jgi:hypothetical protein